MYYRTAVKNDFRVSPLMRDSIIYLKYRFTAGADSSLLLAKYFAIPALYIIIQLKIFLKKKKQGYPFIYVFYNSHEKKIGYMI